MDLDKYLDEYKNVSREELEMIRDCTPSEIVEFKVRSLHMHKKKENNDGRQSLNPGPIVHVLSVHIQPKKHMDKSLSIYGRIYAQNCDSIYGVTVGHDLYRREPNFPEILDVTNTLTLNGPDYMCHPDHAYIPMVKNRVNVELFDGDNNVFALESFSLGDSKIEGGYEQVKRMCIPCEQGSLIFKYVVIPFGVNARVEIRLYSRRKSENFDCINVNGKVVAGCVDTYGDYNLEECVLFQNQSNSFERVELDGKKMQLSRCWVGLPVYSALVVGVNLSEFERGGKIVNGTVKFLAQPGFMFGDLIMSDDLFVQVHVSWFPPTPLRPHKGNDQIEKCSPRTQEMATTTEEIQGMDIEQDYETSSNDDDSSNNNSRWVLNPHRNSPCPSPAIEVFSVFIGREKSKKLQIYGSIETLLDDDRISYIFKRDENDAIRLSEHMNTIPMLDGSRAYEDFNSLGIRFDLKDVDNIFDIKGNVIWDPETLDDTFYRDKQLCSFIQGQKGGFVALHYTIFSSAVSANIKMFLNLKTGCTGFYPKVYGTLCSEYRYYDYSSQFNKDYYRHVLLMATEDDSVQLDADGLIPLSRSSVVVPSYSSLIISVDISTEIFDQKLLCTEEIRIGDGHKSIETKDLILHVQVEWFEVK